jgi:hypothetical protein
MRKEQSHLKRLSALLSFTIIIGILFMLGSCGGGGGGEYPSPSCETTVEYLGNNRCNIIARRPIEGGCSVTIDYDVPCP